jgi:hypothetical protein
LDAGFAYGRTAAPREAGLNRAAVWRSALEVAMGRVTRSRAEALLRAPAPDGLETLERWTKALGARLTYTEGPRLVDAWLVSADKAFIVLMDAPNDASFGWVVEETAAVLEIPPEAVELRSLVDLRDRWAFRGEPAVADPTRRNPRPVRWHWIDVAADDHTLRNQFTHGIVDGLHHLELHEDDEEVRVTVFLGLNHDVTDGSYVLIGMSAWTTAHTAEPVGRRYVNDGVDSLHEP